MPNHCRTYLKVEADPWEIADGKPTAEHEAQADAMLAEFRDAVSGDYAGGERSGDFVLHQVIPLPDAFNDIIIGACQIDGERVQLWRESDGKKYAVAEAEAAALMCDHGATNWYDWSCRNWGTKWDTYRVYTLHNEADRTLNYSFETAWSPPEPVIAALRERFPLLRIQYFWCEEGGNMGGDDAMWILKAWLPREGGA